MSDSVTTRSSQSWFSRIGGAITGMVVGLILFIASFPVLTWNEGRAIHREKTLQFGMKEVVSVPASPVDPANSGKLVHVNGDTVAPEPVSDDVFGISAPAIKLRRNVEMYQWTESKKSETQKKMGGSEETVTTYTYKKDWSSSVIDSSEFHTTEGHINPTKMAFKTRTFVADDITVGDYTLPESLVNMIDDYEALPVTKGTPVDNITASKPVTVVEEGFYVGNDPETPAIGDLKIHFEEVKPGPVSIIARQTQKTFEPYPVKNLDTIELLQAGTLSADSMFASELQGNMIMTWILRVVGFLMMLFGLLLLVKPLVILADVIPFLGSLAGAGLGMIAFVIALPLTICTIAVAWLAYRPLIGLPLFILALASVVFGIRAWMKKRKAAAPKPTVA